MSFDTAARALRKRDTFNPIENYLNQGFMVKGRELRIARSCEHMSNGAKKIR